ncbi:MAG: DUF2628 domain-containing protein [Rhodospirillales bacterium]|nr:MAG: DUF2628 domain-containing protein [Rhodospirillales bacterium]
MRTYTIHLRRHGLDPDRDIAVVKEGFCWPAFFFSVLWALWHRMWLAAVGFFLFHGLINVLINWARPGYYAEAALSLGVSVLIGMFANDLRRWSLARQGFVEEGPVLAPDAESAEQRFFDLNPDLARDVFA